MTTKVFCWKEKKRLLISKDGLLSDLGVNTYEKIKSELAKYKNKKYAEAHKNGTVGVYVPKIFRGKT